MTLAISLYELSSVGAAATHRKAVQHAVIACQLPQDEERMTFGNPSGVIRQACAHVGLNNDQSCKRPVLHMQQAQGGGAEQPLLERRDEEEEGGTSAGLDGAAPRQQPAMSAGAPWPPSLATWRPNHLSVLYRMLTAVLQTRSTCRVQR